MGEAGRCLIDVESAATAALLSISQAAVPVWVAQPTKCSPTMTECPRCKNDISKCDGIFRPPVPPADPNLKQCPGIPAIGCNYTATCNQICNKCGRVHHSHHLIAPPGAQSVQPALETQYGIAHSLGGFRGGFASEHARNPTEQEIWNHAIRSWRDLNPVAYPLQPNKCSPTLTECPRCKNDTSKCDGLFRYPAQPATTPKLTIEQDLALCEANCIAESDAFFATRPAIDFPGTRRIFYAGHRRAWLSYPAIIAAQSPAPGA